MGRKFTRTWMKLKNEILINGCVEWRDTHYIYINRKRVLIEKANFKKVESERDARAFHCSLCASTRS